MRLNVTKGSEETFLQIEEAQAALRAAIEKSKQLTSASEQMIRRHRDERPEPLPQSMS
jgi:hypothetical protein